MLEMLILCRVEFLDSLAITPVTPIHRSVRYGLKITIILPQTISMLINYEGRK